MIALPPTDTLPAARKGLFRFARLGASPTATYLLTSRGLRAFGDGLVSLLLPAYLATLGFDAFKVGVLTTATLAGSAVFTLGVGVVAHRFSRRMLLIAASLLMIATGVAFAFVQDFWPLLVIAFIGTLNPSSGDVSVFLPLEQAQLAHSVTDRDRTALFARYSLVGALAGAVGALAAGAPDILHGIVGLQIKQALQAAFLLYAALGVVTLILYRRLPVEAPDAETVASEPLGKSRSIVLALAALFSLDAFAGGLVIQSLLAFWLYQRFGLSLATAGAIFFWTGVLSAGSYPVAVYISKRIGLVNTMVYTHLPSSLCLLVIPFMPSLAPVIVLLLIRSALSQMDVPTRTSYVMAVVTPAERTAAASITSIPRSLASAAAPILAGSLLAATGFGWPLFLAGGLKIGYDLLLLVMFRKVRPPEERVGDA